MSGLQFYAKVGLCCPEVLSGHELHNLSLLHVRLSQLDTANSASDSSAAQQEKDMTLTRLSTILILFRNDLRIRENTVATG